MEARLMRVALAVAILLVSTGARQRGANFIVDAPSNELAAEIVRASEAYRRDLAVEWLGRAMPNWSQPCLMTVRVGPNLGAGGATSFLFDRGEVYGWRMTIQGSRERILDSVLPHEITHMIFASHFRRPLPRWADEGGATSVECAGERLKHRRMLSRFLRTGRGIAFKRMFAIKEYPRDIMPLYAQGYSLAEFLIQKGGRRKYVAFLGAGLKADDWAGAIRRHYGITDLGSLQNTWLAWVRQGSPPLSPQPAELLAGSGRRPRPEPNLILHVAGDRARAYAPGSVIASSAPGRALATGAIASTPRQDIPSPPTQIVAVRSGAESKALAAAGWHAAGTRPPRTPVAVAAAPPAAPAALRSQVTRPQPFERPRQIILEWSGQ